MVQFGNFSASRDFLLRSSLIATQLETPFFLKKYSPKPVVN